MIRFVLLLLAITLLCEWFAPDSRLGASCARALESHAVAMSNFGHGDLEDEEGDSVAQFELDRRPARKAARRATTAAAVTTTDRRKRVTPFISKKVAARQEFRCAMCGELLQEDWEIDHVRPLQHGGGNELSNLQPLHKRCHAYKNHLEQRLSA